MTQPTADRCRRLARESCARARRRGFALAQLAGGLADRLGLLGGSERLTAAVVVPEDGHPPQQHGHPDHAGQAAGPHRELGATELGRQPRLGVTQAGSAGHHGEERARQPSLEVVGHGPLLHRLAEHGRDHVGRPGQGQQGQPDPQARG